jgi:VanZ family protein
MRWLPFVAACATIALLSQIGQPPLIELTTFWQLDKLLHAIAYAIVGALALVALGADPRTPPARATVLGAWLLALLYGVIDEVHQSFVPGRDASTGDVLADAFGAAIGIGLLVLVLRRRAPRGAAASRTPASLQ